MHSCPPHAQHAMHTVRRLVVLLSLGSSAVHGECGVKINPASLRAWPGGLQMDVMVSKVRAPVCVVPLAFTARRLPCALPRSQWIKGGEITIDLHSHGAVEVTQCWNAAASPVPRIFGSRLSFALGDDPNPLKQKRAQLPSIGCQLVTDVTVADDINAADLVITYPTKADVCVPSPPPPAPPPFVFGPCGPTVSVTLLSEWLSVSGYSVKVNVEPWNAGRVFRISWPGFAV